MDGPWDNSRDPVCGKVLDVSQTAAFEVYKGSTYRFCSTACRGLFVEDPGTYAYARS